jgi:hypothetical protein
LATSDNGEVEGGLEGVCVATSESVDVISFNWLSDNVKIAFELEAFRPTIFIGFNNTLKSITARLVLASLKRSGAIRYLVPELSLEYVEKVTKEIAGGVFPEVTAPPSFNDAVGVLIEDSRVTLRKHHEAERHVRDTMEKLESGLLSAGVSSADRERILEDVRELVDKLLYATTHSILKVYEALKGFHLISKCPVYGAVLDEVIKWALEKVKEELGEESDEVFRENIKALDVDFVITPTGEKRLVVTDLRFNKKVPLDMVSTSVSSMLLFKIMPMAMAIDAPKLIVVEEPEYALAPLQQVVFARLVEVLLDKAREVKDHPAYVVLITHSPFIPLGMKNPKVYYFKCSKMKKFIAEEAWPAKQFALASLLTYAVGSSQGA